MKFLSQNVIFGVTICINLLTFTAGQQTDGFHVLDSVLDCVWTTRLACAVVFKQSGLLLVVVIPLRRRCLRSLAAKPFFHKKTSLMFAVFISDQSITFIIECFFIHDGSFVVIFDHYFDLQIESEYFTVEGFFYSAQLVV